MILLGWGLSWRTGISKKSSDRRAACRASLFDCEGNPMAVASPDARLEGCSLRIGATGTGGVGSKTDDLRRAVNSSSSKTVSCVMLLMGRKSILVRGCLVLIRGSVDLPSSSALIATPIWSSGREEFELLDVPTPFRCTGLVGYRAAGTFCAWVALGFEGSPFLRAVGGRAMGNLFGGAGLLSTVT
jgi:hypothetical protein